MSYEEYIQSVILPEERQREIQRQPASDVSYHSGGEIKHRLQDRYSLAAIDGLHPITKNL